MEQDPKPRKVKKTGILGLIERLTPNKHTTAERMGRRFLSVGAIGMIVLTMGFATGFMNERAVLDARATYVDTFETSRTKTQGTVDEVYRNKEGTRAMVLMHIKGDLGEISTDATTYQAFIAGAKPNLANQKLETEGLTGQIISFGATGYVGLLLESPEPMAWQLLDITMRSNSELQAVETRGQMPDGLEDSSFEEYDQWKVYANPAADEAVPIEALESSDPTIADLYYDSVLKSEESDLRKEMGTTLSEMRASLARINDLTTQARNTRAGDGDVGLVVPTTPKYIDGDVITGEAGRMEVQEVKNDDGTTEEREVEVVEGTYELDTRTTVPGAIDFDWRDGSIRSGYLDDLVDPGETIPDFVERHRTEIEETSSSGSKLSGADSRTWRTTNDRLLFEDYKDNPTMTPLVDVANGLEDAYAEYLDLKYDYQVDGTFKLLEMESQLRSIGSSSTTHVGEDAVIVF